jgi:hypothetical protein
MIFKVLQSLEKKMSLCRNYSPPYLVEVEICVIFFFSAVIKPTTLHVLGKALPLNSD